MSTGSIYSRFLYLLNGTIFLGYIWKLHIELATFLWVENFCPSSSQLFFAPIMVFTRSGRTRDQRNTSRYPSTSYQGASQDNLILVEHPIEKPLFVTPLALLPPIALILFDGSGTIRPSSEDSTAPGKEKGSSISGEIV